MTQAGVENKAHAYLTELRGSLEAYDSYLWGTRNDTTCFALSSGVMKVVGNCPSEPSTGAVNHHGLLFSNGKHPQSHCNLITIDRALSELFACVYRYRRHGRGRHNEVLPHPDQQGLDRLQRCYPEHGHGWLFGRSP